MIGTARKRERGNRAGPAHRLPLLLVLTAALAALAVFATACGGDNSKTTATTNEQGAIGHLKDAENALTAGDLTGPEGATKHLQEAISVAQDQPQVKDHAQKAITAVKKGDVKSAREHITEALAAAKQVPAAGGPTTTVNASVGEFFIKPDKSTVPAGDVEFKATNDGSLTHEFVVIKTNLAPDKLPLKGGDANEDVGPSPGEIEDIKPGKTEKLKVSLKPGKYVIICNLPGHYKNGQRVGITVK